MYLQITTKCNMKCAHCCYSCGKNGKHMDYHVAVQAIQFAREYDDMIAIGGGEPTLHPRFFDILRMCLDSFDYVWMATNGSKPRKMWRLRDIIDGEDYRDDEEGIYQEGKLSVALSQDYFHAPIDERIVKYWTERASKRVSGYEIRNVTQSNSGVIAQGRAKRTGSGWNEKDCVCPDLVIQPSGKVKLCGCTGSPVIGDVWYGIEEKWQAVINDDGDDTDYQDCKCYKGLKGGKKKW